MKDLKTDVFRLAGQFATEIVALPKPDSGPARLTPDRKRWALMALEEELTEFRDADNLEDEADALVDLIYFAAGRFHEMGVNGAAVFREVHEANMRKVRGPLAKRGNSGYDAVKPEDWVGPDVSHAVHTGTTVSEHMGWRPDRRRLKVCVIGHGRHGKDTFCEIMRDNYGMRFQSSSMFCAEKVMLPYFNANPHLPSYGTARECYEDRHGMTVVPDGEGDPVEREHRAIWYEQIAEYNKPDGSRLAREMLEEYDVYCGLRHAGELQACREAGVFDVVVWIDRSGVVGLEDSSSMTVTEDMADWYIDNNGNLTQLENAARLFFEHEVRAKGFAS